MEQRQLSPHRRTSRKSAFRTISADSFPSEQSKTFAFYQTKRLWEGDGNKPESASLPRLRGSLAVLAAKLDLDLGWSDPCIFNLAQRALHIASKRDLVHAMGGIKPTPARLRQRTSIGTTSRKNQVICTHTRRAPQTHTTFGSESSKIIVKSSRNLASTEVPSSSLDIQSEREVDRQSHHMKQPRRA